MFSDHRKHNFDNKDKEARDEEQELIRAKTLMNSLEVGDTIISLVKQLQKKIKEQDGVISAKDKELADKDEKLAIKVYKMNQQLADKDKQLTDKENKLSEAQQKASELEMKVNEMNKLSNLIANAAQEGLLKALRTFVNRSKRKTFEKRSFAKTAVLEIANVKHRSA